MGVVLNSAFAIGDHPEPQLKTPQSSKWHGATSKSVDFQRITCYFKNNLGDATPRL